MGKLTFDKVGEIAELLADYRHNRLEVTFGRKKCSVMALDEMTAHRIVNRLAAIDAARSQNTPDSQRGDG